MAGPIKKLVVEVVDAHDLTPKDGVGTSSPYVIGDFDGQRKKTRIIHRELNPVWNEKLEFVVSDLKVMAAEELDIELYNDLSCGGAGRSDFLGRVKLEGKEIAEMGDMVLRYFPLKMKSMFHPIKGELGLRLYYNDEPIQPPGQEEPTEPPSEAASPGEEKQSEPPAEAAWLGEEKPTEPLAEAPPVGEVNTSESPAPGENEPREAPFAAPAPGEQETLEQQPETLETLVLQVQVENVVEPAAEAPLPEDETPPGEKYEDPLPAEPEEVPEEAPQASPPPEVEKPEEPTVETPAAGFENSAEPPVETLPAGIENSAEPPVETLPAGVEKLAEIVAEIPVLGEESPRDEKSETPPPLEEEPREPVSETPISGEERFAEPPVEALPLSETLLIACAVGVTAYWVIWFCYSILCFFFSLLEHTIFYLM